MIKVINAIDDIIDFTWALSCSKETSSYPTLESVQDVKNALELGINRDNSEILGYYDDGRLTGVCVYYWIEEDQYTQTTLMVAKGAYDLAFSGFLDTIRKKRSGYEMMLGFPASNKQAEDFFNKNNIACVDASTKTILEGTLDIHVQNDLIERIHEENYDQYAVFHDKYALPYEMYFNAANLKKSFDSFMVFAYKDQNQFVASIFIKTGSASPEVFGLFIDEPFKGQGIAKQLMEVMLSRLYEEMDRIERIFFFIDDQSDDELNAALSLGFDIKDEYRCYKMTL